MKSRRFRGRARPVNKLEQAFGEHLLYELTFSSVWFEMLTLRLAPDLRYTPDWMALNHDGEMSFWEVKGPFKREDSWVKLKMAAEMFPWRFYLVTRPKDEWVLKEVPKSAARTVRHRE